MALSFLFGKKKETAAPAASPATTLATITKLQSKLEMLEKREAFIQQKIDKCLVDARERTKRKDKRGALMCLKRKKMFEQQLATYAGAQMNLHQQINALENVSHQADVFEGMREGTAALKAAQATMSVDAVEDVVDDMQEAIDAQTEIADAISRPIGGAYEDDDDLLAEFEELEEATMEEGLMDLPSGVGLAAPAAAAAAPVAAPSAALPAFPSAPSHAVAAPAMSAEEAELAALEAEMAS